MNKVTGNLSDNSIHPQIPPALAETIDWLSSVEEFATIKKLTESLAKYMPMENPIFTDFLAHTLHKAKHYKDAIPYALKTIELLPQAPGSYFNAAKCLQSAAQPVEAEKIIQRGLQLQPDWVDAKIELAVYICAQGRFDEAKQILEELLQGIPATDKNADVVRFNLGWHKIRCGDFKTGIDWLGIGRKMKIWGAYASSFQAPILQKGISVKDKCILLSGEGGAGDEMINLRFAQVLKNRGAKQIIWAHQHPIASLFKRAPCIDKVVTQAEAKQMRYDYWVPAMDLPRILDIDVHEIPNEPYLFAESTQAKKWSQIIPKNGRLRVGLRWQGNPLYEQDLMRSVPFKDFMPLLENKDVDFYSLQKDSGLEELIPGSNVVDLSSYLQSWEDTAGAIENLDLVISSCTSVPHLAAAMGKKVWLLAPINHYYVWATPGESSPWYKDVRLYRQVEFGTWQKEIQDINSDLAALLAGRSSDSK